MRKVVADANALIMPFREKINIDSQLTALLGTYEIIIPRPIMGELEKLAANNRHAKMALAFARTRTITDSNEAGDMSILDVAEILGPEAIVLTNDRELIELARGRKLAVIRLMGGKKLGFDGGTEP